MKRKIAPTALTHDENKKLSDSQLIYWVRQCSHELDGVEGRRAKLREETWDAMNKEQRRRVLGLADGLAFMIELALDEAYEYQEVSR